MDQLFNLWDENIWPWLAINVPAFLDWAYSGFAENVFEIIIIFQLWMIISALDNLITSLNRQAMNFAQIKMHEINNSE